MTRLILDPALLPLQYPRASSARPKKIRLIAQVQKYDIQAAQLHLSRIPNLPQLYTQITLDDDLSQASESIVAVDTSQVMESLRAAHTDPGAIVSVWGFYDGECVTAVECSAVNGQELLSGGAEVLAEMSNLRDL